MDTLEKLNPSASSTSSVSDLEQKCFDAMNDDLNTAIVLSHLFEAVRIINSTNAGIETLTGEDIDKLKSLMNLFVFNILGLKREQKKSDDDTDGLMNLLLSIRIQAKANKDFATSDQIRDELIKLNFTIKDGKDGSTWSKN